MAHSISVFDTSVDWRPSVVITIVLSMLVGFWVSIGLGSVGLAIPPVRALFGVVLLGIVPGGLLVHLLGVRTRGAGEFSVFAVGLSLVVLSVVTVLASVIVPPLGVAEPLSLIPLAAIVSALIFALSLFAWLTRDRSRELHVPIAKPLSTYAIPCLLPVLAVVGAWQMSRFGANYGMGLFVVGVALVTLLSATRLIRPQQYPVTVFLVAVSVLLHRNLTATHVVGADIQYNFFLSSVIAENHQWAPDVGGSLSSLPVVAAVPAAYSVLTGLELTTVLIVVYPIIFATVPVGLYYLARDLFGTNVALYGCLFFVFYHGTFYHTPEKQQLSQVFVVLLLLLYFHRSSHGRGEKAAAVLLAIGLVQSHYGSAYVFGLSALAASIGLFLLDRIHGGYDNGLSPLYPTGFLVGATAWYAYASSQLLETLASIPVSIVAQLATLGEDTAAGSGASYVAGQEALVQQVNLALYVLLTLLIALGLAWKTSSTLYRVWRDVTLRRDQVEFTAIALPLFLFLGTSYVLIVDLWADRVYQMVLLVLAPFAVVGFSALATAAERAPGISKEHWSAIAALLAALFVINAGLAGAAIGSASDYTFNEDAHDYSFSDDEIEAAEWIESQPDVEPVETAADAEALSEDDLAPIYTDRTSSQLFRAVTPEGHYTVEIVMLKDEWEPTFEPEETRDGYVFIRHAAIDDGDPDEVPVSSLSAAEVEVVLEDRSIAYQNDDVTIVEPATGAD